MLIIGSVITPNNKKTNFASIKFMVYHALMHYR